MTKPSLDTNINIPAGIKINNLNADLLDGKNDTDFFWAAMRGSVDAGDFSAINWTAGHWAVNPAVTGMPLASHWWNVICFARAANDYRLLIASSISDNTYVYIRTQNSGAWGEWLQIGTSTRPNGSGTIFPGSPATGSRFFRTDLGFECFWNGTYWLTVQEYAYTSVRRTITATGTYDYAALRTDYRPYFTSWCFNATSNAPMDASNYWVFRPIAYDLNEGAPSVLASHTLSPANGWSAGVRKSYSSVINYSPTSYPAKIGFNGFAIMGSPGGLVVEATLFYRLRIA